MNNYTIKNFLQKAAMLFFAGCMLNTAKVKAQEVYSPKALCEIYPISFEQGLNVCACEVLSFTFCLDNPLNPALPPCPITPEYYDNYPCTSTQSVWFVMSEANYTSLTTFMPSNSSNFVSQDDLVNVYGAINLNVRTNSHPYYARFNNGNCIAEANDIYGCGTYRVVHLIKSTNVSTATNFANIQNSTGSFSYQINVSCTGVNAQVPIIEIETQNPICAGSEVCFITDLNENGTMQFESTVGASVYTFDRQILMGSIVRKLVSSNANDPILPLQFVSYNTNGQEIVRVCYTYPTIGNYQPSRTNRGTCGGQSQSRFLLLKVLQNKADFTAYSDCNGNVTFTPTVQCANPNPSIFNWNFGDGTTGTSNSNVNNGIITHQYTSSNAFNVSLSANGGATISYLVNTVVGPSFDLQAIFSSPTKACSLNEVYFISGLPSGFSSSWGVTGGIPIGATNTTTLGVNWTNMIDDDASGNYFGGGVLSLTITNGKCTYVTTYAIESCCASPTATQNISSPKGEISINDVFPSVSQLTGGNYYIDGRLIIDKDFTLNGTHFKMGPYAEIEVLAPFTFTLNNAKITSGCVIMWQHILINNKASFVAKNNTRIEDGITAVYGDNGGAINIKDSYLNKNYIAVTAVNYNNGTYPLEITNTKISCSYALPYASIGVTYPNIGLRPPYLTERGLRGIELDMVENAKIGDPTNSANKNEFYQLDYGIYARRSSVEVYNNHFKEIYDPNKINSKEYAIYANNLNKPLIKTNSTLKVGDPVNPIAKNKFEVCEVGIETNNNVNSYIYNNTFDDMFWAVRINFNNNNNTVKINQNNITDMMRGVECNLNTWCNTDISLNSFNYNQTPISMPANAFGEYGILINEENKPAGGIYTIKSNTVRNVVFGVEVKGTDKTTIENNKIRIEPLFVTSTTLGYEAAIRILNTSGTSAKCNDIATTASAANIRSAANFQKYNGVFTSQAIGASIIDNKIENIGAGTNFGGTCTGCSVFKNDFKKLATGVFLSHGVQLGTQGSIVLGPVCKNITSDNTWATPLTQNTTVDALTMNPTNIANTKFVIRTTNNGSPYAAQSNGSYIGGSFLPTGGITNLTAQGCYLDQNCHTKKTPRELVLREKLAKSQISFAQNEAVTKYINKALIYSEILADDSLAILSPVLTAFRDSATSANLGALQSIKAILTDTLLQTNVVLVNALAQNNSLIVNELPEATRQQVNNIVLQAAIVDTLFTTTQVDSLRNIAMLCPYIYGPAVFSARALVNYYDPINTHYFNDCEKISTQTAHNRSSFTDFGKENIEIRNLNLIPNPATNSVNIEFFKINEDNTLLKEDIQKLEIIDLSGRVLAIYNAKQTETSISLIEFATGVYFIKATNKQGMVATQKLFINKNN